MLNVYEKYPQLLLLVDKTYKLLDLRLPVYLMLVLDSNGLNEIVGLLICSRGDKGFLRSGCGGF